MSDVFKVGTFGIFPTDGTPDVTEFGTRGWWDGTPSPIKMSDLNQTVELNSDIEMTVSTNDDIENTVDIIADCEHIVEGLET